ncbi:MFS transporter permease [Leuconostoc fallax]|uniref:MFS transporter permease n=1 Tax=Leuconostoc fallax TaxID=1251 RepID=UPI00209150E9|nr:MFS transporter permease [Leuconostoc fallax]MCO6183683.1 MFS transporter permease [Leuconostoc fallax]
MWHYIKFELKNTVGYSLAMIVGGLLPLMLAIGNYHATPDPIANQALAKGLFATLLPMIPLGLVILPFTIAFGRDTTDGVTDRLVLFGYSLAKQLIAKFVSVFILVNIITVIYCLTLLHILPLPNLSILSMINIFTSISILSLSLYLLAFTIAQVFQGFHLIQGVAMVFYFGIAFLTGSMGTFQLPSTIESVMQWIPFSIFRETLKTHWATGFLSDMQSQWFKMIVFLFITVVLFCLTQYYRYAKRHMSSLRILIK